MPTDMTIFVIDDDQDDVDFLVDVAKELYPSVQLIVANDGESALELLDQINTLPDVIFVDRNMPRMDGKTFLLRLKDDNILKNIPVVMHSTNFSDSDLKLYSSLSAYTMQKQVNFGRMLQEIKILLEKIESGK